MKEIALKEREFEKLKRFPLDNIVSTESEIYYYKKNRKRECILLKKIYHNDYNTMHRKELTIENLEKSDLANYEELVIPDSIVTICGIKTAFTIKEITDSTNLHLFLINKRISTKRKLEVLKKIGELLDKTQHQNQEFYFCDLQDYNFLVDKNDNVFVVDLDGSATNTNSPIISKYIALDDKTYGINKYKQIVSGYVYPSTDVDNFCYNTMILNFLSQTSIGILSYEEYIEYLNYLLITEMINEDIYEILMNQYTNKYTESIGKYIDCIPETTGRASYKVYKQLKKIPR